MAHPEAEWPSQQSSLIFYCFLFHHFLVPLADKILAEQTPERLQWGTSCLCRGGARHSENTFRNTAFANCAN